MKVTVEIDSIINMAVELIRRKVDFTLVHNKILGGVVVSATFESSEEELLREARDEVARIRARRKQL